MPLYVRALPEVPGEPPVFGPYLEENFANASSFAQISSARAKVRRRRELIWVCGKRQPVILEVYFEGKRVFPKGKGGDHTSKRFKELLDCMGRSGSKCSVPEGSSPKKLVAGRKRILRVACPVNPAKVALNGTTKSRKPGKVQNPSKLEAHEEEYEE
jgi:hypothetical protein